MLTAFRRRSSPSPAPAEAASEVPTVQTGSLDATLRDLARRASGLGRDAAEVDGIVGELAAAAQRQAEACRALVDDMVEIRSAGEAIATATGASRARVEEARTAVGRIGEEVVGAVETLGQVSAAAANITQIALQTRLVAFNASVEAKRAGEAGRGFAVVAEAVKDLAAQVEASSKQIMSTVARLDVRIGALAQELRRSDGGPPSAFHAALDASVASVEGIAVAARQSVQGAAAVADRVGELRDNVEAGSRALGTARERTHGFLRVSESLLELTADSGIETEDTPYITEVVQAAGRISAIFERALVDGTITLEALFDDRYVPVPGTDPQQVTTRFTAFTDRVLPELQEPLAAFTPKVVFCAAVDRNGYLPTHNHKFSKPQGTDPVWNAANSRNRRIFDDRTGLAAARNRRRFLLQTYRRDMGGGRFVLMKDLSAPILVQGRHWGGLRMAYQF